jgi:hypothetical protein
MPIPVGRTASQPLVALLSGKLVAGLTRPNYYG